MRGVIDTADTLISDANSISPNVLPLDLDTVRKHLRFVTHSEDDLILGWIQAASEDFERETGIQILTATREFWMDSFPWQREIELPRPPLQTIAYVAYDDTDGTEQVFDGSPLPYLLQNPQGPLARRGRIALAVPGVLWPQAAYHAKAVRIRYTCGYGDSGANVPQQIKTALYLLVANYHKFRSEVHEGRSSIPLQIPVGAQKIIDAFKFSASSQLQMTRPPWSWGSNYGYGYVGGYPWRY
jgi:uncharacterized phiE125 gp8 family phage protein